jgi:hypothetical protein
MKMSHFISHFHNSEIKFVVFLRLFKDVFLARRYEKQMYALQMVEKKFVDTPTATAPFRFGGLFHWPPRLHSAPIA